MSLYKKIVFLVALAIGGITPSASLVCAAADVSADLYSFNRPLTKQELKLLAFFERDALSICFDGYAHGEGELGLCLQSSRAVSYHFSMLFPMTLAEPRPKIVRLLTYLHNNLCARFLTLRETNRAEWERLFGLSKNHLCEWSRIHYFEAMLDRLASLVKGSDFSGELGPAHHMLLENDIDAMSFTGVSESNASTNEEAIAALMGQMIGSSAFLPQGEGAGATFSVSTAVASHVKMTDSPSCEAAVQGLFLKPDSKAMMVQKISAALDAMDDEAAAAASSVRESDEDAAGAALGELLACSVERQAQDSGSASAAHSVGASHAKVNQARTCEGLVLTPDSLGESHPVFKAIERAKEMQRRAKAIFETRRREPNTGPGVDRASDVRVLSAAAAAASTCAADAFAELYETVEGREYQGSYARGSKKASEMECYERRMEELRQEHQASALKRADQEERNVRHQARGSLRPTMLDEALSMTRVGSKRSRNAAGSVSSSPSAVVFVSDSAGSGSPETMNLMGADDLVSPSASALSHGTAAALSPAVKRRRAGAALASIVRTQGVEALLSHYHPSADGAVSSAAMPCAAGAGAGASTESAVIVIDAEEAGASHPADPLLKHLELYEKAIIDLCCEKEMTAAMQAKIAAVVSAHPRFMWFVYHRLVARMIGVGSKLFQNSLKNQHEVLTALYDRLTERMKGVSLMKLNPTDSYSGPHVDEYYYGIAVGRFLIKLWGETMNKDELISESRIARFIVPLIPDIDDELRTTSSSQIAGVSAPHMFGLSTATGAEFMQQAQENPLEVGKRSRNKH